MSANQSLNNPPSTSTSTPTLNKELLYFKEDILKDVREIESKIYNKVKTYTEETDKKLLNFETITNNLTERTFKLSTQYSEKINLKENLETLIEFKTKTDETLLSHETKSKLIAKELRDAINKFDKIINENIIYPGVIGTGNSRFPNLHNFIDFVLLNIKDKSFQLDLKSYKSKVDTELENLKNKIDEIAKNNDSNIKLTVSNLEKKLNNVLNMHEDKMFSLRIENTKSCQNLDKHSKNLINELEQVYGIKNDILGAFDVNVSDFKNSQKIFYDLQRDFYRLRVQFDELKEWLKGNRNVGKDKNKKYHVESYLKKYIDGEASMNDILRNRKASNDKENYNYMVNSSKKNSNIYLNKYLKNDYSNNNNLYDNEYNKKIPNENLKNKLNKIPSFNKIDSKFNANFPEKFVRSGSYKNSERGNNNIKDLNKEFRLEGEDLNNNILRKSTINKNFSNRLILKEFSGKKDNNDKKNSFVFNSNNNFSSVFSNTIDFNSNNYSKGFSNNNIVKIKINNAFNNDIDNNDNNNDNNLYSNNDNNSNKDENFDRGNKEENEKNGERKKNIIYENTNEIYSNNTNNSINNDKNKNMRSEISNNTFVEFNKNIEKDISKIKKNINGNNPMSLAKTTSTIFNMKNMEQQNFLSEEKKANNDNINNIDNSNSYEKNTINNKTVNNKINRNINNFNINDIKKLQQNFITKGRNLNQFGVNNIINSKDKEIIHRILKGDKESVFTFQIMKKDDITNIKNANYGNDRINSPLKAQTYMNNFYIKESNVMKSKFHVVDLLDTINLQNPDSKEEKGNKSNSLIQKKRNNEIMNKKKISNSKSADKIRCYNK